MEMITSPTPLIERMTLLLSNHFATAYSAAQGVDVVSLIDQHNTIRTNALGSFATLTHALIDDLALSCYLSNNLNHKSAPNENMGRELMELFLLGPGNYTETDVKEVARALTGYELHASIRGARPRLVYDETLHDDGRKTILGTTDNFTPHGVVDHLLSQPAASRFVATKLITAFVSPVADVTLVDVVAGKLAKGWRLDEALRTIFNSPQFKAITARQIIAKTTVEHIIGVMHALQRQEATDAVGFMNAGGQVLFEPPTVAGWPSGKAMLGPGSILARYNAAAHFAGLHARKPAANTPTSAAVTPLIEAFGLTSISRVTQDALNAYTKEAGRQTTAALNAGLITVLASSPDFQLS